MTTTLKSLIEKQGRQSERLTEIQKAAKTARGGRLADLIRETTEVYDMIVRTGEEIRAAM